MSTDRRRDAGMDKLLRRALDNEAAAPGEDCPAPADVAGFLEGRLSGADRARLEQHFSTCGACQETLAAIGAMPTAPGTETVAPRATWLSPARLRWLVPATAAAVILIAYVASNQLPKRAVREARSTQVAEAARAPQMAMRSTPSLKAMGTGDTKAEAAAPAKTAVVAQQAARPQELAKALPAKPDAQAAGQPPRGAGGGEAPLAERAQVEPREEARTGKPGMLLRAATAGKSVVADRAAPAPAGPAPGPAPAVALPPPPVVTEQRAAPVARSFALAISPAAEPGTVVVEAPDRRSLWRFVPGSGIWHSADAGASWQQQAPLPAGRLVAGAAPDAVTCWAIGRDGLVMLTIDGATWQTRTAPVRADLTGVEARDGRAATVTAADGRRFVTTDGGASWTPAQ